MTVSLLPCTGLVRCSRPNALARFCIGGPRRFIETVVAARPRSHLLIRVSSVEHCLPQTSRGAARRQGGMNAP